MGLLHATREQGRFKPPKPRIRGLLTTHISPPLPRIRTIRDYNAYRRAFNRGSGIVITAAIMDDICYRLEQLEQHTAGPSAVAMDEAEAAWS